MLTSRIAVFLVLAALGACRCGEPLQVLAPKIEIGDPYDPKFSVCNKDFVHDCSYAYNDVGIGRPKLFSFMIKNPSPVDLLISSITVEGSPHFTLEGDVPSTVESNIGTVGKMVTVKYSPETETDETAQVIIVSDAENLAKGENVVINLTAKGVDLGTCILAVQPPQCDFGAVGVGAQGQCTLTLQNNGSQECEVTDIGFTADTSPVFAPIGVFIIPAFIQPGTGQTVAFSASPTSAVQFTGTLVVGSNDPVNPQINVPFTVQGANTPTCVARVKSINGTPNASPNPPVEPLDNVLLSGDQSVGGTPGATITAYRWTLTTQPPESSATLSSASAQDTGFTFSSAQGNVSGVDVAGTFVAHLVVTDSTGAQSQNDCAVTLNAIPTEGLHVQLSWSASVDDIDLHVAKGNSPDWCSANDCYYANCTFSPPNWDGQAGFTSGDPKLDIDDLEGFGPENTNIIQPINGSYVIGVHAYSGNPNFSNFTPTDIVVKIFVGGALVSSMNGHLNNTDDFWTVARVDVNGGSSVTPIDTMQTSWTCF